MWQFVRNVIGLILIRTNHVAMRQTRRADILWSGENEVSVYDRLRTRTQELQKNLPAFIKELVEKHLEE
jgi:uncharacterized NAD(P)/FAD-binding protein YdhS